MIRFCFLFAVIYFIAAVYILSDDMDRFAFYGNGTVVIKDDFPCDSAVIFSTQCVGHRNLRGHGSGHSNGHSTGEHNSVSHNSGNIEGRGYESLNANKMMDVRMIHAGTYMFIYNDEWEMVRMQTNVDLSKCYEYIVYDNTVSYTKPYICVCSHEKKEFKSRFLLFSVCFIIILVCICLLCYENILNRENFNSLV